MRRLLYTMTVLSALATAGSTGCDHSEVGKGPQEQPESPGDSPGEDPGAPAAPTDEPPPAATCVPGALESSTVIDTLVGSPWAHDQIFRPHSLIPDGEGGAILAATAELDSIERGEVAFYFLDAAGQLTQATKITRGLDTDNDTQGEIMRVGDTIHGVMRSPYKATTFSDITTPEIKAEEREWVTARKMQEAYGAIANGDFYAKYHSLAQTFEPGSTDLYPIFSIHVWNLRTEEKLFFHLHRERNVVSDIVLVHGVEHPWLAWVEAPDLNPDQTPLTASIWAMPVIDADIEETAVVIGNYQIGGHSRINDFQNGNEFRRTHINWYRSEDRVLCTLEDGQGSVRIIELADDGTAPQALVLDTMHFQPSAGGNPVRGTFLETDAGLFFLHSPDATHVKECWQDEDPSSCEPRYSVGQLQAFPVGSEVGDTEPIVLGDHISRSVRYVAVDGGFLGVRVEKMDIRIDEDHWGPNRHHYWLNTAELVIDRFGCQGQ